MRDELARRLGILDVRQHHDHRSPSNAQREVRHRVPEIGLDVLRPDGVQRLRDPAQLSRTALRLDEPGDAVVEGHHADAVAV